ncbi:MAG: hypothetical protein MUF02_04825 [Acidobacteria bacterium]|nr:hypothetical protein [Acidobacteriota bacterium]
MKKTLILLCGLLLVSGLFAFEKKTTISINFGIMDTDQFKFDPLMWTAGAELDLQVGNYLMFSPEVTLVGNGFKFKEFLLFPAAILNFTPGNFFVGGGITKGFYIGSGEDFAITEVALKLNAGLISKNLKLTVYVITAFDSLFDGMLVGASLGFRL